MGSRIRGVRSEIRGVGLGTRGMGSCRYQWSAVMDERAWIKDHGSEGWDLDAL